MTKPGLPRATLEPVRFGEFLRDRHLLSDEQWLAALADHWSSTKHRRIGQTIIDSGFLPIEIVEAQARAFHDELDVVEIADPGCEPAGSGMTIEEDVARALRSEKPTLPAAAL